jgi:hypothetical protein
MCHQMPNGCGGQVNGGEEVASGFIVARGDGAEELEPGEEVLEGLPWAG